jgi:hypothetical protein
MGMELQRLDTPLTVCKVADLRDVPLEGELFFLTRTEEELSLVCPTRDTPANTLAREDGWRGLRVRGVLDFALVGILARISAILAAHNIGIFAVSTYNTDYVLVKAGDFDRAMDALAAAGYTVL